MCYRQILGSLIQCKQHHKKEKIQQQLFQFPVFVFLFILILVTYINFMDTLAQFFVRYCMVDHSFSDLLEQYKFNSACFHLLITLRQLQYFFRIHILDRNRQD